MHEHGVHCTVTRSHEYIDDRHHIHCSQRKLCQIWSTCIEWVLFGPTTTQYYIMTSICDTTRLWCTMQRGKEHNKRWPKPIYKAIIQALGWNSINLQLSLRTNKKLLFCYVHFQINYRLFVLIIRIKHGRLCRKFDEIRSFVALWLVVLLIFITKIRTSLFFFSFPYALHITRWKANGKRKAKKQTRFSFKNQLKYGNNDSHNNEMMD